MLKLVLVVSELFLLRDEDLVVGVSISANAVKDKEKEDDHDSGEVQHSFIPIQKIVL